MKKLFLSLGLSILLLNSCTTRVVSAKKPYSDSAISVGQTYTIVSNDGKKDALNITKIDEQNIFGKNVDGKEITIEKSKITEIKKTKVGGTILLVAGVIGLALVGTAFYHNKPVGQF